MMQRQGISRFGGLLALALSLPGLAQAAPQTFNTALPVADGNLVWRQQVIYLRAGDDAGTMDRDLTVRGGVAVLGYGINRDLALFGMLPYLDKSLDLTLPNGQRVNRGTRGIGDARLFARYTLVQRDRPGSTFRIAPFAGMDLPTGTDNRRDSLGRLPQPLQSGSGSWDPLVGVVLTYQTLNYQFDTQVSYQANTRANGFQFGDELRADASFQYRLLPRELGAGVPGFLYGAIETNLIHREKNQLGNSNDPNSGGTTLWLSPGLQYVTRRWMLETVVQIPVAQDLGGAAREDDYAVRSGFRVNF